MTATFEVVSNHNGTITLCLGRRTETRFSHGMTPQETEELARALLREIKAPAIEKTRGGFRPTADINIDSEEKAILKELKKDKLPEGTEEIEEGEQAVEEEDGAKAAKREAMQQYMAACPHKHGSKKFKAYQALGYYYLRTGRTPPKD